MAEPGGDVPALEVQGLTAGYGALAVIHDVSFRVAPGEIVGLLGRNGAGKTTTLLAIAGFLGRYQGEVLVDGRPAGRAVVPAGSRSGRHRARGAQHLPLAHGRPRTCRLAGADLDESLELFPELRPKLDLRAGLLSGGEQQMLALARTISRRPSVLLIDEVSFGLAPIVCERIFERLRSVVNSTSIAMLVVEQHIHYAESVVDRALIMNEGAIRAEMTGAELAAREDEVEHLYLGAVDEMLDGPTSSTVG